MLGVGNREPTVDGLQLLVLDDLVTFLGLHGFSSR